jgi:hypothetical protein
MKGYYLDNKSDYSILARRRRGAEKEYEFNLQSAKSDQ